MKPNFNSFRYLTSLAIAIFAMLLLSYRSIAQSEGRIAGAVTDGQNNGLASATITLLLAGDSSLVKAGMTDAKGRFDLTVARGGTYLLSYSLIGYAKKYAGPVTLKDGESVTIETEKMEVAGSNLAAATVAYKKQMMEVRPDKTVFNVESSITATGSNAMEMLKKTPGVQVDQDDNITMKGKNGVKIYVDGKMMALDNQNVVAYLKSINSNDIEAIEAISSPGARYDASGNAGIVNIRLKKNKKYGANGSASLGFIQGITPKGNASVNVNYRDKKINVFGSVGGSVGRDDKTFQLNRIQKDTLYDAKTVFLTNDKSLNARTGADLSIDSKNTIGVLATVNYTDEAYNSSTNTAIYDQATGLFIKDLRAANSIPGSRTNADFNLNYRYANAKGREINFDADYGLFRSMGRSYQPNYYYGSSNDLLQTVINRNYAPTDIDIYTAKLDLVQKLGKGKLEYGAKFSRVETKNTYDFFTDDAYGKSHIVPELSSSFDYTETVNAGYADYQWQPTGKLSVQAGLRLEQTNSDGELMPADAIPKSDDHVTRNYLDLFPTASLTLNLNPSHSLNLAYNRRIDRPTYQNLNPFEIKLDELTYIKGNAFLRPQYTDNITLTHTLFGKINTSVGYSYVRDYATMVTDTVSNALYAEQKNVGSQQVISFGVNSSLHFAKWWNGFAGAWYSYQLYRGAIGENPVKVDVSSYGANMQQSFTLGNDYSAELTGWFNGPGTHLITWKLKAMGGMDLGLQKLLFHKQAALTISATDIFHTAKLHLSSDFGGVNGVAGVTTESQTIRASLTWRFGSNQIKNARERQTGLENETRRIKNSN